jgi:N-acetylmuramoyl-L-alanine amidase
VVRRLAQLLAVPLALVPVLGLAALAGAPAAARASEPSWTVVLDPGHGGAQDGAISPRGDKEKDLTLEISRRVKRRLEKLGAKVVLARTGDQLVPLANRAAVANALQADVFVSIHLNSMPTAEARRVSSGVETYFMSADATDAGAAAAAARENADRLAGEPQADPNDAVAGILDDLQNTEALADSSRLAYALQEKLVGALKAEDRGVKQAPFYVLAGARMPAVLVEVGFISQEAEAARLKSAAYQERAAEAITAGILAWRAGGPR